MNANDQLAQAISAIHTGSFTPEVLQQLSTLIEQGAGARLMHAATAREPALGDTAQGAIRQVMSDSELEHWAQVGAVRQVMSDLERLASVSEPIAVTLMVHLRPIAGPLMMHEVFDAIGLWIHHCPSEMLKRELRRMASS